MNPQEIPNTDAAETAAPETTPPVVEEPAQKTVSAEKVTTPANPPPPSDVVAAVEPTPQAPAAEEVLYCICRSKDETAMIQCDRCNEWFHFRCMNIVTQVSASSPILQPDFNFCVNALPRSLEPGSSKFLRNISKALATHRFGDFSRPSTANGILFGSGTILSFKLEAPCCRFKSFAFKSTYSASWQAHGRPRRISSFLVDF